METPYNFFRLRILARYDEHFKIYVAQCLETGSVATADDQDTLLEIMTELLEDEIGFALQHKNLSNLFSTPAPHDVWIKWRKAAKKGNLQTLPLNVEIKELPDEETSAGVAFADAA